jgi:hypothetical protein
MKYRSSSERCLRVALSALIQAAVAYYTMLGFATHRADETFGLTP